MARLLRCLPRMIPPGSVASLLKMVRHMEGELPCEKLRTQCTCKKNGVRPVPALRFFSCPRILAHAFVGSYGCKERKDEHPERMVRPPVRFVFVPNWDKNSSFLRSAVAKTGDPLRIE